jgi:hypothetical protein
MLNKTTFKSMMALLSEKFGGLEISHAMAALIWESLKPFPDDKCVDAFRWTILHGRFAKDVLPDLLSRLEVKETDQATLAWLLVEKAIRGVGNYESVKFSDPVIHSVIDSLGGWAKVSMVVDKDLPWLKRDFETRYHLMASKTEHPGYLIGKQEMQYIEAGLSHLIRQPVMVGFKNRKLLQGEKRVETK